MTTSKKVIINTKLQAYADNFSASYSLKEIFKEANNNTKANLKLKITYNKILK